MTVRRPRVADLPGVAVVLCALAATPAVAQTNYVWIQNAGGTQSWAHAANWSDGVVPEPVSGDTISMSLNPAAATFLDLAADRTFGNLSVYLSNFNNSTLQLTVNSGHTVTLAGATPTITVGGKPVTALTMENMIAGIAGLKLAGPSPLILNNASNSFSGGIELSGGVLSVAADGCLGHASNDITFSGSAILRLPGNTVYERDIILNDGAIGSLQATSGGFTQPPVLSNAVTGMGGIVASSSSSAFANGMWVLASTSNDFSGPITVNTRGKLQVNSLVDSTNTITLVAGNDGYRKSWFIYGGYGAGAAAPLYLNQRQIVLNGQASGHYLESADTNDTYTMNINTDLIVTRTTAGTLYLQGVNAGENTIAGCIPDGPSGSTTLKKEQGGTWVLSGENTYTGPTTVSGGILKLASSSCLPDSGTLTINGGKLELAPGVRERVDGLVLGTTPQTNGVSYGSHSSRADHKDDTYFAGPGMLYVGIDPPPLGSVLSVR